MYRNSFHFICISEVIKIFYIDDNIITEWIKTTEPNAVAVIEGGMDFPDIKGTMRLYQDNMGVFVAVSVVGLPSTKNICMPPQIFAIHIHDGVSCENTGNEPFSFSGMHFNPNNCPHPYHAGDLPQLFSANGRGFFIFLTNRFTVDEVIGKTVIIHQNTDDFNTQPSGNAGTKIACGVIKKFS